MVCELKETHLHSAPGGRIGQAALVCCAPSVFAGLSVCAIFAPRACVLDTPSRDYTATRAISPYN